MTQVNFYLTTERPLRTFCQLLEKVYRQNLTVYVQAENEAMAHELDDLLWIFRDISFVPHHILSESSIHSPIEIGFSADHGQLSSSTILCNLTSNLLPSSKNYERIIEIVENSEEAKQNSRHKYRAYQKEGFEIQVIPLNE